jgi:5-formyltetrahydrofolate cyclo-ligase
MAAVAFSTDAAKQRVREAVWSRMERERVAAFPGARGRIPNFVGAWEAARRLAATPEWKTARTLKCNPDAPQRPVRLLALRDGKTLFMAGSVAVDGTGARVGKGGGYSDLEYALGRELGFIDARTPVATTVHAFQVAATRLPVTAHDVRADLVVTAEEVLRPGRRRGRQPAGIMSAHLTEDLRQEVPILSSLGF